jgi:hypothetical protein
VGKQARRPRPQDRKSNGALPPKGSTVIVPPSDPVGAAEAETLLAAIAAAAISAKEKLVAEAEVSDIDDLAPLIQIQRAGSVVATAFCDRVNRDDALEFTLNAVPLYAADAVTLVLDTHYTASSLNPVTGKEWGPGEMQGLCDTLGYCEKGLLTDALYATCFERDGRWHSGLFPYHAHHSEPGKPGRMSWSTDPAQQIYLAGGGTSELQLGGFVADTVTEAFSHACVDHAAAIENGALHGISADQVRFVADCSATRTLLGFGQGRWSVALPAISEEAHAIMEAILGRA